MHAYVDIPEAIEYGENLIVHREAVEATPYLPNVIVSTSPSSAAAGRTAFPLESIDADPDAGRCATSHDVLGGGQADHQPAGSSRASSFYSVPDPQVAPLGPLVVGRDRLALDLEPTSAIRTAKTSGSRAWVMPRSTCIPPTREGRSASATATTCGWMPTGRSAVPQGSTRTTDFAAVGRPAHGPGHLQPGLSPGRDDDQARLLHGHTPRTVRAQQTRPDGRALAGRHRATRRASVTAASRASPAGWAPPMHQTDSLFHKRAGAMGFTFRLRRRQPRDQHLSQGDAGASRSPRPKMAGLGGRARGRRRRPPRQEAREPRTT